MNTVELISIIIASIATILGGVWFIVNKAFNFGKTTQRINEIDERTITLQNDVTILKSDVAVLKTDVAVLKTDVAVLKTDVAALKTDVAALKIDVESLKREVFSIKNFLILKYEDALVFFSLKNSPLNLSDFGNLILKEINGMEFIHNNKESLFSKIDDEKPRTALDVETSALMTCLSYCNEEEFDNIKNFVYNSPEYSIKDNKGNDKKYILRLTDVCFILSIPLRDLYLSQHPEITL